MISRISGITSLKGRLTLSSKATPTRMEADRSGKVIRMAPSSPTTPAETPSKTVSVKRRRSSNSRLAVISPLF